MAPEKNRGFGTWFIVVIIALLVAGGAWWYHSANQTSYTDDTSVETPTGATTNDGTSAEVNGSGQVNFGTVDDLPAGTSYPDAGK